MRMRSASCASIKASAEAAPSSAISPKKPATATRVPKFLRCLYDILHSEDPAILAWSKDGTHFQIFNTARLEAEILPKYFKHGKFASFQRQLNNFGFRKWTKTQSNVCTFSHHHYVRRKPQQLVELVALLNETTVATPECASSLVAGDKPQPLSTQNGKRKRSESACDAARTAAANKAIKREPASHAGARPANLPLIKVDQSAFDFEVESWSLMADIRPLEWATKSRLAAVKSDSGNETPTSAAGFADMTFDFTLEELDDILLTSSSGSARVANEGDEPIDPRLVNEWYGVEPPLSSWADGPELFGKAELEMYMQDTELWAGQ